MVWFRLFVRLYIHAETNSDVQSDEILRLEIRRDHSPIFGGSWKKSKHFRFFHHFIEFFSNNFTFFDQVFKNIKIWWETTTSNIINNWQSFESWSKMTLNTPIYFENGEFVIRNKWFSRYRVHGYICFSLYKKKVVFKISDCLSMLHKLRYRFFCTKIPLKVKQWAL